MINPSIIPGVWNPSSAWSGLTRDILAQVVRINWYRLDLSSFWQNISKNVFGLSVGTLQIVLLIFLEGPSCGPISPICAHISTKLHPCVPVS